MLFNVNFSKEEQQNYLESVGYRVYQKTIKEWVQSGNHDSIGEWIEFNLTHAEKEGKSVEMYKAFNEEIGLKIKKMILE